MGNDANLVRQEDMLSTAQASKSDELPLQSDCLIGGTWAGADARFAVLDKYTGVPMAQVAQASAADIERAVTLAADAVVRPIPNVTERAAILLRAGELIARDRDLFRQTMIGEAGFTCADADNEIDRALVTIGLSADAGKRLVGDMVPFGCSPGHESRLGFTLRFPLGVVCAITPFNSPLNTVLHKVAPAFAAGNAVVLKPSALTPLTAGLLCERLLEAGFPPHMLALLHGSGETIGERLLGHPAISFYAFTGSTAVGRHIQKMAGLRRTQMELGSIASTIVCADADLSRAIPRIANAAFRKAGQVCTSVQMLYVERPAAAAVVERLQQAIADMPAGDPRDPKTKIGPMISESAARRAESWIAQASEEGAELVCGGARSASVVSPTILRRVRKGMKVVDQEVFAPLLSIVPFDALSGAIAQANATPYGLSAGVFTTSLPKGLEAARQLRFGAIHLNEASSARADVMPFGGVKDSGFGHEGPDHAIREMTEERLITING